MISGEKILVTGVSGVGPFPIARMLARDNEVWGLARFNDPTVRRDVEAAGITTRAIDLGSGDMGDLPRDFTHVLHFAWWRAPMAQLDEAIRMNVEGTGFVLEHCRKAKSALVISGMGVYGANTDPWHAYTETDPIGRGATAYAETSPVCKVGLESVSRFCARAFNLKITIARLNTVFGLDGTYHAKMIHAALQGRDFSVPCDPNPHSPIHTQDMQDHVEALLGEAGTPALITNWCGDEMITSQEAAAQVEAMTRRPLPLTVNAFPGAPTGTAADPTRRQSITGPCKVKFKAAFQALHDELIPFGNAADHLRHRHAPSGQ